MPYISGGILDIWKFLANEIPSSCASATPILDGKVSKNTIWFL
jgi:hypothetical protein